MSAMKRIYDEITTISEVTGYGVDFLCERVTELVEDGDSYAEALSQAREVSLERDW